MHAVEKSKLTGHPMTTALSVSSSKFKWQWPNCPFLLKIFLSPLHHSKFKVQTTVAQSPLSIRDFTVSSSPKFRQQWPKSPLSIQDVPVSSSPFKVQTTVTQSPLSIQDFPVSSLSFVLIIVCLDLGIHILFNNVWSSVVRRMASVCTNIFIFSWIVACVSNSSIKQPLCTEKMCL